MVARTGICNVCNGKTARRKTTQCITCRREARKNPVGKLEYRRRWHMLKKHNISADGFDLLWQAFSGKCGICNIDLILPTPGKGQPRNAAVIDHNHTTGNLRGLLCNSCNKALGLFNDSVISLRQATKWLEYSDEKISNN